jgi:twitching motility protein PilT
MRLHGSLKPFPDYPVLDDPTIVDVINQVTLEKHRDTLRSGKDVDFAYLTSSGFRNRCNVFRQRGNHAIALRLLREDIPTGRDLGLPPVMSDFAMRPRGLILVTGPTGSGKSTTLAAMVDHINRNKACHIITIEDPIEYIHNHKQSMINQREVNVDVDDFASALRSALREDPDVILVGEMRDFETISAAITAAETGHLVMSTLHTTGAAETLDRIIDVYPPHSQGQCRSQLAINLVAVVSQTLVPTANGKGRIAAMEIMSCTDAVSSMIRENKIFQIPSVITTGKSKGMFSLDQDLARLVRQGLITQDTGVSRCQDPKEFKRFLEMAI